MSGRTAGDGSGGAWVDEIVLEEEVEDRGREEKSGSEERKLVTAHGCVDIVKTVIDTVSTSASMQT